MLKHIQCNQSEYNSMFFELYSFWAKQYENKNQSDEVESTHIKFRYQSSVDFCSLNQTRPVPN